MTSSIDEIVTNIDRGRAVIKAATSAMKALDSSAAAIEDAIAVKGDVAAAVQLWRHDGRQTPLAIDSLDRRRAELSAWTPMASEVRSAGAHRTDWARAVSGVASINPVGLAVTSAVTLFDDYLERQVHRQGYEKLSRSLDRGLAGIDLTFNTGLVASTRPSARVSTGSTGRWAAGWLSCPLPSALTFSQRLSRDHLVFE
jgi:hypothetical protein